MITAIIVNYHTASLLPVLIKGLLEDSLVGQIILVDNSEDEPALSLLPCSPRLRIIINEENRGFGPAVNQALEYAEGDWILIVNPDVRLEDGCLDHLVNAARTCDTPLVGPRFYGDDRRIFRLSPATGSCLWFDLANMNAGKYALDAELLIFYWTIRHERFWAEKEPFFEPFLSGACLLVNTQWIMSNGGKLFDDNFFLYFEDTDLCARAVLDGVRPLCVPRAEAIHYYDQSPSPSEPKSQLMARAHSIFIKKHYGELPPLHAHSGDFFPRIVDLGTAVTPPTFEVEKQVVRENPVFEMGVNPWLVPFAQASVEDNFFEFPADAWDRLASGVYYGRFRDPLYGIVRLWRWSKQ